MKGIPEQSEACPQFNILIRLAIAIKKRREKQLAHDQEDGEERGAGKRRKKIAHKKAFRKSIKFSRKQLGLHGEVWKKLEEEQF